jgi:hypothetical protein
MGTGKDGGKAKMTGGVNMIWTEYKVTWLFLTKLCGSVPSDPDIVKKWLNARQPEAIPAGGRSIDEVQEEVFSTLGAEQDEVSRLVFQRVDGGLVMRAGTIRAHMKDCARVISAQYVGKIKGERSFATKVVNGVYPDESQYWIPIVRTDGTPVMSADGELSKAVHVRGPRGEQLSAIKVFEYVEGARMDFRLKVLGDSVKQKDLETLLTYGGVHGYAGERGDGEGKYTFVIEKIDAE